MRILALVFLAGLVVAQGPSRADEPKTTPKRPVAPTSSTTPSLPQLRVAGNVYVGDLAPDFMLTSSRLKDVRLSEYRGNWVVLRFVSERRELPLLEAEHARLTELGLLLVGVCKDPPQALRALAERSNVPFDVLADATGEVSAMYGLYDEANARCRPGFLILDRQGVVRLALQGEVPAGDVVSLARFALTVRGF